MLCGMDFFANIAIGKCLADVRRRVGLTQSQLAVSLGVPQSFVAKTELGERGLRVYELFDYAKGLGVPAGELLSEIERALTQE